MGKYKIISKDDISATKAFLVIGIIIMLMSIYLIIVNPENNINTHYFFALGLGGGMMSMQSIELFSKRQEIEVKS